MNTPIVITVCGAWAGYLLLTGHPVRAFEVALGTLIFLGIRWGVRKLFFRNDPTEG